MEPDHSRPAGGLGSASRLSVASGDLGSCRACLHRERVIAWGSFGVNTNRTPVTARSGCVGAEVSFADAWLLIREGAKLDDAIAKSLEEFRNRKIYDAITVDLLNQLADSDLEQALIDYIGTKFGDDYVREREIISGLKPGLRALYITWWVEAEVINAAFHPNYLNHASHFPTHAPNAFEDFGVEPWAALIRGANRVRSRDADA